MLSDTFQLLMSFFAPLPAAIPPAPPPVVLEEASAPRAPEPNAAGLTCTLSVDRSGTRLVAEAIATREGVHGNYELMVLKTEGSNRSRVRQGGEFDAVPGRPERIGAVNLTGHKGAVQARLTVDDGAEPVVCSTR